VESVKSVIRHLLPRITSLLLKVKLCLQIYKNRGARDGCTRGNNRKITDFTDSAYRLMLCNKGKTLERNCGTDRKKGGSKMGETSKHASSKHKRKEHRLTEKSLARDGSARLAEAAKKREASEAAATRKAEAG
jgi:hypothetical protein